MAGIIEDPDFTGFNGVYIGDKERPTSPKNDIDFNGIAKYMKANNKEYKDLTEEEIARFKL